MIKTLKDIYLTRSTWFGLVSLLLTFAIAIGWQTSTPLHSDDFYYLHWPTDSYYTSWDIRCDEITSYDQVADACLNHWLTNNGRLSNLAYLAVIPLPDGLINTFIGLCIGAMALLLFRNAGRLSQSLTNPWLAVAVPILLWMGLPWHDQFQSADFQFNYTLPSVMLLGLLPLFGDPDRKPGRWGWVLLCVFAPWHECFSMYLGIFLGINWLFYRRRNTLIAIGILIIGFCLTMSPGTLDRSARSVSVGIAHYPYTMALSSMWPALIGMIWWLLRRHKVQGNKRRLADSFALGILVLIPVAFALLFILQAPQRSHWPVELLGMALIVKIIATYRIPRQWPMWVTVPLVILYAAWGTDLVRHQLKTTEFSEDTIRQLQQSPDDVIIDEEGYLDRPQPFWLMGMTAPQYTQYENMVHCSIAAHAKSHPDACYVALPLSLRNKPFDQWPKVPGNNDFRYASGDLIVRPHVAERDLVDERIILTFGNPTIATTPFDYVLSALMGRSDSVTFDDGVGNVFPVIYQGDTLDVISMQQLPRTAKGRRLVAVDIPDFKQ